jgi:CRP-like cAMP-binding protein
MNIELNHLIADIPIFNDLNADDTDILRHYLFPKELAIGDIVCKEGQHGNFLSFVANGELKVIKNMEGKDVVISTIEEGGSLGEMSLIDGLTRSATTKASKPSTILILRRDDFNNLIKKYPVVGVKILKGIARLLSLNLRKTSGRMTSLMT